jgi:hypothetical protein
MTIPDARESAPSKAELEKQLDDALKHTFPASDPITIGEPTANKPDRPVHRRPALIDKQLVNELANNVVEKQRARRLALREQPLTAVKEELIMPSKSPKQHRFMEAAAHNPAFAKKAGIPQKVAKEFVTADKAKAKGSSKKGK